VKGRLFLFLLPLLILAAAVPASRTGGDAPVPTGGRRIPFTLRAGKVILPVTVGDSRVLQIILDTGMSFEGLLLYNSALIDSIALTNVVRANVGGAGAGPAQTAVMADSISFRAGDIEFVDQRIVLLEGDAMKGFPSDGVCGYSLFGPYAVELDYDRMAVLLHAPGEFSPDSSWAVLSLTLKTNTIPWTEVAVSIGGADSASISCYIDLASSETVEFLTRDGMKFELPADLEDVYLGRGLSGDIYGKRGTVAWLRLGPYRVDDVTAAFTPAEVRSKQPGADAVLGNGLLRRFHCVFDYRAGRLYLKPHSVGHRIP